MKKVKEWIEYTTNDTKMKESLGKEYKLETQFQPLYLTVAGDGGSGKSVLVKTIVGVIRQIFQKTIQHWWEHQLDLRHSMEAESQYTVFLGY